MFNMLFSQILSRLGLSGFASPSSFNTGSDPGDDTYTDGEASFSFTKGQRLAPSEADRAAMQDRRVEQLTDTKLFWPGKSIKIPIRNEETSLYRFALSLTNLDASYYTIRPPVGGTPQRDFSVLLEPGQEATIEVMFLPLSNGQKGGVQQFSFVISSFDPRRNDERGNVYAEEYVLWVPRPSSDDFRLTVPAMQAITRPWRRAIPLTINLQNLSYLPPSVNLRVLRAPTRDVLLNGEANNIEQVGAQEQTLDARTGGTWRCLLPPSRYKASYVATVQGTARAANNIEVGFGLPKPIYVRYVPWLRRGRDWAFLGGSALGLLWLFWGIPVPKTPVVRVALQYDNLKDGQLPEGMTPKMVPTLTLTPVNHRAKGTPIEGEYRNGEYVFELPRRWMAYRWPFGWAGHSRTPQEFELTSNFDKAKDALGDHYVLDGVDLGEDNRLHLTVQGEPVLGEWNVRRSARVEARQRVRFNVTIVNPGSAANLSQDVKIKYVVDNIQHEDTALQQQDGKLHSEFATDAPKSGTASVYMIVNGKQWPQKIKAKASEVPYTLTFQMPRLPETEILPDRTPNLLAGQPNGTGPNATAVAAPPKGEDFAPNGSGNPGVVQPRQTASVSSTKGAKLPTNNATPSEDASASAGPPKIFEINKDCKPGEVVTIRGHALGKEGQVALLDEKLKPGDVQWTPNWVKFHVPKDKPANEYPVNFVLPGDQWMEAGTIRVKGNPNPGNYNVGSETAPGKSASGFVSSRLNGASPSGPSKASLSQSARGLVSSPTTRPPDSLYSNRPGLRAAQPDTLTYASTQTASHNVRSGKQKPNHTAPESAPSSEAMSVSTAYEQYVRGDYAQAKETAHQLIAQQSGNSQAHAIHALTLAREGGKRLKEAEKEVRLAQSQARSNDDNALALTAQAYLIGAKMRDPYDATNRSRMDGLFEQAQQMNPYLINAYTDWADMEFRLNSRDTAQMQYNTGASFNRRTALFYYAFNVIFQKHGETALATKALGLAQRLNPSIARR